MGKAGSAHNHSGIVGSILTTVSIWVQGLNLLLRRAQQPVRRSIKICIQRNAPVGAIELTTHRVNWPYRDHINHY